MISYVLLRDVCVLKLTGSHTDDQFKDLRRVMSQILDEAPEKHLLVDLSSAIYVSPVCLGAILFHSTESDERNVVLFGPSEYTMDAIKISHAEKLSIICHNSDDLTSCISLNKNDLENILSQRDDQCEDPPQ
jgi:anti-anti-sigma regulatory factor